MDDSYVIANFHSLCRLCLQKSAVMVPLFENAIDDESIVPLTSKIADNFEVQVKQNDGLPARICYKCLYKVEKCTKFRLQCLNNDSRLRQLSNQANSENDRSNSLDVNSCYDSNQETSQKNKEHDYIVEDSVVMVVDPSLDYDSEESVNGESNKEESLSEEPGTESFYRKVFFCQFCDHAFITLDVCRQHENSSHNPTAPYNCIECGLIFAERTQQVQHVRIVHCNDKPYQCPQCEKCFVRRSDLRKHSIVHTGIRPFQCHFCFKSFSRNTNLSKHLRIHSGNKPHVCPICPRSFMAKVELQKHVLVHSGMKPYKCQKCLMTFGRRDKLVKHEMKHEQQTSQFKNNNMETDIQDMVVNVNPYNNIITSPLQQSINTPQLEGFDLPSVPDHILGDIAFANDITKLPSTSKKPVDSPGKAKPPIKKKPNKNIKCHHCTRRFPSLDAYKTHISLHMGLRNFQCSHCPKKFSKKKELDRHSSTHANDRTFDCGQCNRKFTSIEKLVTHEETHDKTMINMPCIECGIVFEKKSELVAHIKSHITQDFEVKLSSDATESRYPDLLGNEHKFGSDEIKKEPVSDFSLEDSYYDMET